ncbi:MAG: TIGR03557 family F420-dependent LLM class oxidoreductase [Hamadaea sp.]|nr:TIGR03557 family F420-dependent LLM class oxidoreductase [Hamadaea sp.]
MKLGLFLSSEEYRPDELVAQAKQAAAAGFEGLWISDHFHPWLDAQGQSPFVWSMIGAVSQVCDLPITTAVTCPIQRIHPVIVAQAAATSAVLTGGRFQLGVGTGEALNESIVGDVWPPAAIRQDMLEEAVELMRALWTGEVVTFDGDFYTVHHARIYTLPETPPPVYVSAYGPRAVEVAARIGDGFVSTRPDARLLSAWREKGGGDKPAQGGMKVCYALDEQEAVRTAHEKWRSSGLPGEMGQILPTPEHFEQASSLVTEEMTAKEFVCGADPKRHLEQIRKYADAGFDELYIAPIGPHHAEMIAFYESEILPAVR